MNCATPHLKFSSIALLNETQGTPLFGEAMLKFLNDHLDVDYIMFLAYHRNTGFEPLIHCGAMLPPRTSVTLTNVYCRKYFRLDPNFEKIQNFDKRDGPSLITFDLLNLSSSHYRSVFWQRLNFGSKCSLIFSREDAVFYCNLYRSKERPEFSAIDCNIVEGLADFINGLMAIHYRLMPKFSCSTPTAISGKSASREEKEGGEELDKLSQREKLILRLILTGLNSEAIALDQNLAINTVKTYRKRLYRKLKVSSLNELHAKFIRPIGLP